MNKRQKKKAYKRKYELRMTKELFQKTYSQLEQIGKAMRCLCEKVGEVTANVIKMTEDFKQKVERMPEEEFEKIMNDERLNIEQKALLRKIRQRREKNGDNREKNR